MAGNELTTQFGLRHPTVGRSGLHSLCNVLHMPNWDVLRTFVGRGSSARPLAPRDLVAQNLA